MGVGKYALILSLLTETISRTRCTSATGWLAPGIKIKGVSKDGFIAKILITITVFYQAYFNRNVKEF